MKRWNAFSLAAVLCAAITGAAAAAPSSRIITFKDGTPSEARAKIIAAAGGTVLKELPFINGVVVSEAGKSPMSAFKLKAMNGVELVELNTYRIWIDAALPAGLFPSVGAALKAARDAEVPAVPKEEKPKEEERSELPWGVARVKAPGAWGKTTGKGVKVCVIDTGVDFNHPDLAENYAGGYNAIDPEADAMDGHGHGTHVAGTIAGVYNEMGVIGVAPHASLFGVKVLDEKGGGSLATILAGIEWAVENKMDVVNMSLGGPGTEVMHKAVRKAYEAGVTIVAAAGNDPDAPVSAPAMYPETIAVSASTVEDGLASFSTTGPEVDFIAPGHEIISTWPERRLAKLSGTSMACPHVAGLAALAHALGARGTDAVRDRLAGTVRRLDLSDSQQGRGLIEADKL